MVSGEEEMDEVVDKLVGDVLRQTPVRWWWIW